MALDLSPEGIEKMAEQVASWVKDRLDEVLEVVEDAEARQAEVDAASDAVEAALVGARRHVADAAEREATVGEADLRAAAADAVERWCAGVGPAATVQAAVDLDLSDGLLPAVDAGATLAGVAMGLVAAHAAAVAVDRWAAGGLGQRGGPADVNEVPGGSTAQVGDEPQTPS